MKPHNNQTMLRKLPVYSLHSKPMLSSSNNYHKDNTMLELFTKLASSLASFMFIWAMLRQFIPIQLRTFTEKRLRKLFSSFRPYVQVKIPEYSGYDLKRDEAYISIQSYLASLPNNKTKRLTAEIGENGNPIVLTMDEHEQIVDEYKGIQVRWVLIKVVPRSRPMFSSHEDYSALEKKYYKVTFHQKHRDIITNDYLKFVVEQGKELRVKNRQRRLYTNVGGVKYTSYGYTMWTHTQFEHPATFDSVAMDSAKKRDIIEDLEKFTKSKEFYAGICKAWKGGYLLYGPPGTGKSTLIAAMANWVKYDVYDLELTAVKDNTELRKLLIETTGKSMIVIEDIDCSLHLTGQRKKETAGEEQVKVKGKENAATSKVTLSGLLNFIDGIWSSCGGERIIVFTTNYLDKLDPALVRKGRMDKHIEMSYCSYEGFKVLAKNYLSVEEDDEKYQVMFDKIKVLLSNIRATPADVAETLMPKSSDGGAEKCLRNLITGLNDAKKRKKIAEEQAKKVNSEALVGYYANDGS